MRITWYLKQLFPFTYRSQYATQSGEKHFAVWNMWFGKCFNIQDFVLA